MGDQEADIERIKECAAALKRVHDTFSKRSNPAKAFGTGELGSQRLLDAFDEFDSNWKVRRRKLTDELLSLHKITKTAADSYEQVDSELANALRESDKRDGRTGS
ncbi:hypothetical protein [Streptomyces sp. NPDC088725]|uniref:hypothetical protein n=1 Tax=Streptomyces sp. NPDC088725 TaxID=3365873 RepID=UPI00382EC915